MIKAIFTTLFLLVQQGYAGTSRDSSTELKEELYSIYLTEEGPRLRAIAILISCDKKAIADQLRVPFHSQVENLSHSFISKVQPTNKYKTLDAESVLRVAEEVVNYKMSFILGYSLALRDFKINERSTCLVGMELAEQFLMKQSE